MTKIKQLLIALFLTLCFALNLGAQDIPPFPEKVSEAVRLSNLYAYNGQPKNTMEYWAPMYDKDPDYFWRRMLGWQAEGGPDQALSGRWAVPPMAWFGMNIPPSVVVPSPPPVPIVPACELLSGQILDVRAAIDNISVYLDRQSNKQEAHILSTEKFQDGVKSEWAKFGKFAAKYILPAVGGILGGKYLLTSK